MTKREMFLLKAISLILCLPPVYIDAVAQIKPLRSGNEGDNEVKPTNSYGQGEVMGLIPFPESSSIFRRVEKVDPIPATSSKTETVDMSPKLAASDDEDIFWEVTRVPENRLADGSTKLDYVNGNHPDLFEIITHDHVDKTTGHSAQTKRVKKILPPFDGRREESTDDATTPKRNTRNISKEKMVTWKVSDLKEINHMDEKSNDTASTMKEATEKGLHAPGYTPAMIDEKERNSERNNEPTRAAITPGLEFLNNTTERTMMADKKFDEQTPAAKGSPTTAISSSEVVGPSLREGTTAPDTVNATLQPDNDRFPGGESSGNAGETANVGGKTTENGNPSSSSDIDIPKGSTPGVHKVGETVTDAASETLAISLGGEKVDGAPDGKNSKTQLTDGTSMKTLNDEALLKMDDLKIQNPEFLLAPEKTRAQIDEFDADEVKKVPKEKDSKKGETDNEIRGIPLVPDESESMKQESATQRSIWDLLRERESARTGERREGGSLKVEPAGSTTSTTPRSLYGNFDAESAEVEYETENFQHGYSNIEKHELPFSYALPWLEIKDKGYNADEKKQADPKKSVTHTKINDFPSILPMNKNYLRSKDEIQIPKDLSKLLKLSQNDDSVNGVTVSIVDSGTNHEDTTLYGHRPSKWYLLLLTGNSTIVKLRRKDFTKYLKLNLAARLSVEYDDIKVNKVILAPPKVLVNISVYAPSEDVAEESQLDLKDKFEDKGEAPLYKLAKTNATLLELSGEEYHVVRFLSLQSQQPEAEAQKDSVPNTVSLAVHHDDVEFIVYTFVGSACACAVVLTLFVSLGKYLRKISEQRWPWKKSKPATAVDRGNSNRDEFNGISPAVIYSGGFPQIRGSWMSGVGSRVRPPPADNPSAAPPPPKKYPGIEMGMPQRKNASLYPETDTRSCSSPRHNKLQIYGAGANNLVLPVPPQKSKSCKTGGGGDVHPLDVRIPVKGGRLE